MNTNQQVQQQIERSLKKVIAKYPEGQESGMTDIHILISPYTGEMCSYDDDENELDRCVVTQWIKTQREDFYTMAADALRECIEHLRPLVQKMAILQPFSFVLIDEDKETLQDLCLIDESETVVIGGGLLENMEEDLDDFLRELLKD
ncbi:MAG: hypothetical protein HUK03_08865, partial [Bacteroidaceae bacterium]|nr:hypothetical protein [Bacteroidaceae bacterium]